MKKQIFIYLMIFLAIGACKKDKSADFVTDYSPTLTEAANTSYSGDYYPFATGYNWYWSGSATTTGSMTVSAGGQKQTQPLDGTESVAGHMIVLAQENITLPSGTYEVLPTDETDGLTRYFQVTNTQVIIRAIKMSGSSIVEVTNPVFLKRPLVVGDKWETQPSVDYNQLMNMSDLGSSGSVTVNTKCMIFVLGQEAITWNSTSTPTIALQERASITGSVGMTGVSGTINFNFTLDSRINLKENVGIVKQTQKLEGTMGGTLSYEGQSVSLSMNMTMNATMTLNSYNLTSTSVVPGNSQIKSGEAYSKTNVSTGNQKFDAQIAKTMQLIKKIQNSLILK
jgi:hypothetical protein